MTSTLSNSQHAGDEMNTEADKLAELLPCPFCGCDDFETSPFPHNRDRTIWAVVCGNPHCSAELLDNSPARVIARWNRRAAIDKASAQEKKP